MQQNRKAKLTSLEANEEATRDSEGQARCIITNAGSAIAARPSDVRHPLSIEDSLIKTVSLKARAIVVMMTISDAILSRIIAISSSLADWLCFVWFAR